MTKKDYVCLADLIKENLLNKDRTYPIKDFISNLIHRLKLENNKFNEGIFMEYLEK
tara:strand:+ start:28 stop:195 length:168 start_codon:yes stop_codon:yes gene_type:complete